MSNIFHFPDYDMAYRRQGQGIPLVLVHGFPLNSRMWLPQLQELSQYFTVIAPDLRGHGCSSQPDWSPDHPQPYSMDLLADDLARLLDVLEISEPVILGGLSMGGYIALAFQRRYPQRLAGLLLAATRPGPDSPAAKEAREKSATQAMGSGVSAIAEAMLPRLLAPAAYTANPDLIETCRSIMLEISLGAVVGDLLGMHQRPDSNPQLAAIRVPVLVVHGDADQIIPVAEAQAMAAAIPGAKLVILPGAGHMVNLEASRAFNQAVKEHFKQI